MIYSSKLSIGYCRDSYDLNLLAINEIIIALGFGEIKNIYEFRIILVRATPERFCDASETCTPVVQYKSLQSPIC